MLLLFSQLFILRERLPASFSSVAFFNPHSTSSTIFISLALILRELISSHFSVALCLLISLCPQYLFSLFAWSFLLHSFRFFAEFLFYLLYHHSVAEEYGDSTPPSYSLSSVQLFPRIFKVFQLKRNLHKYCSLFQLVSNLPSSLVTPIVILLQSFSG